MLNKQVAQIEVEKTKEGQRESTVGTALAVYLAYPS